MIIKLDTPITLSGVTTHQTDETLCHFKSAGTVHRIRTFTAAAPYLALLEIPTNIALEPGKHYKIELSWRTGAEPQVPRANVDKQHRIIKIVGKADQGANATTWTEMARGIPKTRPGGYRLNQGRKPLSESQQTVQLATSVLTHHKDDARLLGNGNPSSGVRKAIEAAITARDVSHLCTDPETRTFNGRMMLNMGTGWLPELLASAVDAGIIAGEVTRYQGEVFFAGPAITITNRPD